MSADLVVDGVGIRTIVTNDIAQVKETVGINTAKLNRDSPDLAAPDLAVYFYFRSLPGIA